jgi:anti-anti-sigma factor
MTSSTLTGTKCEIAPRPDFSHSRRAKDDLTVSLADLPGGLLVSVHGTAGVANLDSLDSILTRVLATRPSLVVLDFVGLTMLSSLAMGMLISFRRSLARWGGRVKFASTSPSIRESLETARLTDLFELHATVEEAFASA